MKRFGFWTGVMLLAAVVGGALAYKPWTAYFEQRRITAEQNAEMNAAEKKIAESESERSRLESRTGKEAQARKQGFMKPGERPLESNRG